MEYNVFKIHKNGTLHLKESACFRPQVELWIPLYRYTVNMYILIYTITEHLLSKAAYSFELQIAQVWYNHNVISSRLVTLNKRLRYKQLIMIAYV